MKRLNKFVLLILPLFLVFSSTGQEKDGDWTYIVGGQKFLGVDYRTDGTVVYGNELLMVCEIDPENKVTISLPSKLKGLAVVHCLRIWGESSAVVINTKTSKVVTGDIVPKGWRMSPFLSWSPRENYLLLGPRGEVTNGDMFFVDLQIPRTTEIHFKDLARKDISETQDFVGPSVSWTSDSIYELQIDVFCNIYELGEKACDPDKVLRSVNARVNVSNLGITYGISRTGSRTASKNPVKPSAKRKPAAGRSAKKPIVSELGAGNVWQPEEKSEEPFGPWEKIHEKCGGGGGFDAWRSTSKKLGIKQRNAQTKFISCISTEMKKAGASPAAIAFTKQMDGDVYMYEFTEMGKVDLAVITAPLINDPNVSECVLVNGEPKILPLYEKTTDIDITRDPLYATIQRKFPDVEIWPMHGFEKMENLARGGQRFIFDFLLLNGCRACEIAGSAFIAFDFNSKGKFVGTELVRLEEYVEGNNTEEQITTNDGKATLIPVPLNKDDPAIVDKFDGMSIGNTHGIEYADSINNKGAVFTRLKESRIEYPTQVPGEGTIELLINVKNGYQYNDFKLNHNLPQALIFTTTGADVWYPGSTWLTVSSDGTLTWEMSITKYEGQKQTLIARNTRFRFNEWHSIGISYGSSGQYILLDGVLVASAPGNSQKLRRGGNYEAAVDFPTIGELASGFWANNRYDGGFEGILDTIRISEKQKDWVLTPASSNGSKPVESRRPNK